MKVILRPGQPQYVNTETNKQKILWLLSAAEVMLKVMAEVISAETAPIKWSEVFFIRGNIRRGSLHKHRCKLHLEIFSSEFFFANIIYFDAN